MVCMKVLVFGCDLIRLSWMSCCIVFCMVMGFVLYFVVSVWFDGIFVFGEVEVIYVWILLMIWVLLFWFMEVNSSVIVL